MIRINGHNIEAATIEHKVERAILPKPEPKKVGEEIEHKDDNTASDRTSFTRRSKVAPKN